MSLELRTVRLDRPLTETEDAALTALLPPARAERIAHVRPEARQEPLCAYALLALALRERFGWREIPEIALAEGGKPIFPRHPDLHFNLSHTRGAVLAGLAGSPVGVDVERIRPIRPRTGELLGLPEAGEDFFRGWVRREARAKRTGTEVGGALRREPPPVPEEAYHPLDLFPGYAAGAACSAGETLAPLRRHPLEELLEGLL